MLVFLLGIVWAHFMGFWANPSERHFSKWKLLPNSHWFFRVNAGHFFGAKFWQRFGSANLPRQDGIFFCRYPDLHGDASVFGMHLLRCFKKIVWRNFSDGIGMNIWGVWGLIILG